MLRFKYGAARSGGYMDRTGKVIIEPQFDYESDFFHGLARVLKNGQWGYINEKGQEVIPFRLRSVFNCSTPTSLPGLIESLREN